MTAIYHITHIDNLPGILAEAGLWCDNARKAKELDAIGIAHDHIKQRRARKNVPIGKKGTLADYVPFYFAPRSPMLYALYRGQVQGYNGTQQNIVHLTSSVEAVIQQTMPFVFTDGHAVMDFSEFFNDISDLSKVDWKIMKEIYWRDTNEDGDRTRRRQAEFLVHRFFPWSLVTEIGVMTDRANRQVMDKLQGADHLPQVVVRRDWYY
ncbi:MAG TPA: DUF4433 domain-containing protein [Chthonomonadaceae bacterium]|nr:DUF4433 domain-containing protein [Chthonomonadaceae bacterium]